MLVKRIAACTHIYLQPFPSNSTRKFKSSTFKHIFAHFGLPGYAPGTIAVNATWMARGFDACKKPIHIYLQPFLRYSKLLVENCDIFIPHLCIAAPEGVTPSEFRENLDAHKTRMNGLLYGEESMTICSAVLIQYQRVTDGQADRLTDRRTAYS